MMATYERKCEPQYFQALWNGEKTVELREEEPEHPFAVGDRLLLREWKPDLMVQGLDGWDAILGAQNEKVAETLAKHLDARGYTGLSLMFLITHIVRDPKGRWLQPGVVALSLRPVEQPIRPMRDIQDKPPIPPSPEPRPSKKWSKDDVEKTTMVHLVDVVDKEHRLAQYHQDHHATRRKQRHHCRYCTHLGSSAMDYQTNHYTCAACGKSDLHGSSQVPILCVSCAITLGACVQCGGQLD